MSGARTITRSLLAGAIALTLTACSWPTRQAEPAGDAVAMASPSPASERTAEEPSIVHRPAAHGTPRTTPRAAQQAASDIDLWQRIGFELRMAPDPRQPLRKPLAYFHHSARFVSEASERARPITERFESNGRLDALFATNEAGAVAMHAFGVFRIGVWDPQDVVGGRVVPLTTSEDLSRVEAVAASSEAAAFAHLDASYVSDHAREVYLASIHASHLATTLESMRATLEDARGKFESGYREPFAKAISKFNDTLSLMFTSVDASMDPAHELRKHLEISLVTGTFDEPLEHFFTMSLKMGQVKRLAKDIDAALSSIHETLVATMSPLVDAVVLRLGSLLALARMSYGDEGIGLRETTIEPAIALSEQFMYDLISTARAVTTRAS